MRGAAKESPPARRRGSKQSKQGDIAVKAQVASRAEAWIETSLNHPDKNTLRVASRAEAWIETTSAARMGARRRRRLPRGGVDRNLERAAYGGHGDVASRAEAWIETGPVISQ